MRLCNYVDVYYNDHITAALDFMRASATTEEIRKFLLRAGDVCVTKDSEEWNDIAVAALVAENIPNLLCGYHLAVVRPHSGRMSGAFLARAFLARGINDQFRVEANGITRFGLGAGALCCGYFPVPPLAEQCAIATFLDRETARIDALVAKKERLMALLQEKRTALISHAVTKGLNPNAPMKDSGVKWIGQIPAHWDMRRLKFLLSGIDQGWSPQCDNQPAEEGRWGVLKTGCVNGGIFDEGENKSLPDNIDPPLELEVRCGDVLMSRASGSTELVGSVALVRQRPAARLLLSDKTYRLRFQTSLVEAGFLIWVMGSPIMRHQIAGIISGAEGLANNIGQNDIRNLTAPLPPLAEQRAILGYVRDETAKLDALVAKIRTGIERLQEYRTALISAAVTGKIDVRERAGEAGAGSFREGTGRRPAR